MSTVSKLPVVATAAVILAVILAACTSSSAPTVHHSPTGVVAWISTPSSPTTSTTTTTTTLAPAPLCIKSELRGGPSFTGAATGNIGVSFRLTNIGKATCRLQGYPELFAITQTGNQVLVPVHHGTYFIDAVPGNLSPKASGYFVIGSSNFCLDGVGGLHRVHYRKLVVYLPDGARVVIGANILPCGPLEVSQVGVQPLVPGELPPPEPGTASFLQVSVHLPARIVGGRILDYIVELANPGSRPVELQPCPDYRETLRVLMSKTAFQRSYKLNCRAVGLIGAYKSVRFEMEIPVPKVSMPAEAKFVWLLDTPYHQGWGHAIRVYP